MSAPAASDNSNIEALRRALEAGDTEWAQREYEACQGHFHTARAAQILIAQHNSYRGSQHQQPTLETKELTWPPDNGAKGGQAGTPAEDQEKQKRNR